MRMREKHIIKRQRKVPARSSTPHHSSSGMVKETATRLVRTASIFTKIFVAGEVTSPVYFHSRSIACRAVLYILDRRRIAYQAPRGERDGQYEWQEEQEQLHLRVGFESGVWKRLHCNQEGHRVSEYYINGIN